MEIKHLKIRAILFTEPKHLVSKFLHRTVRKLDNHLCRDLVGQTRLLRRIPQEADSAVRYSDLQYIRNTFAGKAAIEVSFVET